jgi:hypothetical protein
MNNIPADLRLTAAVPWTKPEYATPIGDITLLIRQTVHFRQLAFQRLSFNSATAKAITSCREFGNIWAYQFSLPGLERNTPAETVDPRQPHYSDFDAHDAITFLLSTFLSFPCPCYLSKDQEDATVFLVNKAGEPVAILRGF